VLDPAIDRVDPWPMLVELLVRHVLLPRELLPQIKINSHVLIRDRWDNALARGPGFVR
jgi:hypothetical protein